MTTTELSKVCLQVRRDIINMTANAGSGHPGGSLSCVELMTSVFFNHMRVDPGNPKWEDRDRFVLSKGHAAPCYYAVLAAKGFFSRDEYANFRQLHGILQGHPDAKKVPGVDASTGSLGQGVSIAVGMALGAKHLGKDTKVFVLAGDGESQEGQIWEAYMAAAHYQLDNLTVTSAASSTTSGKTKLTVSPALTSGNSYKYKVADNAVLPAAGQSVKGWTAWNGTDEITAATGTEICVVECDSAYRALKAGVATVTAKA